MTTSTLMNPAPGKATRWLRFLAGLMFLAAFFGFFASGYSLPGIFGEVLRHNQANDIDASPLLYSEVEHMAELEAGVAELRRLARERVKAAETRAGEGR